MITEMLPINMFQGNIAKQFVCVFRQGGLCIKNKKQKNDKNYPSEKKRC